MNRIIELKEQIMEEKERSLERQNRSLQILNNSIRNLSAEIDVNYTKLWARCLNGNEFCLLVNYIDHLDRLKSSALGQKAQLEKKIAAIRAELVEMLKEIKTLNALKEKADSTARRAQERKYQKLLDEMALRMEGYDG